MTPPVVHATDLALSRGGRRVLGGLSMRLEAGQMVGLMGPNGSGKTSLLRALMGFEPPAAGALSLFGTPLPTRRRALWQKVACVFQAASVDVDLTVTENVSLGAALYGLSDARQRARWAIEQVGLGAEASRRCRHLSGGMRRRVELARALLVRPELMLLDEATAGLDLEAAGHFWRALALLRAEGCAVLTATHQPHEAAHVDRLLVVHAGQVVADAPPMTLLGRIGGDVITCEAQDPAALVQPVAERLGVHVWQDQARLVIVSPAGHALIPRLVEAVGPGRLHSVSLRRPSLADVFFQLTGGRLEAAGGAAGGPGGGLGAHPQGRVGGEAAATGAAQ